MAINTQAELVNHLRFLSGDNSTSLTTADAVSLLNFGIDQYSYLAITSDGRWQFDDTENTDVPRASVTLNSGEVAIPFASTHLTIRFAEITDAEGNKARLDTFDRRDSGYTTPKTTDTGQPSAYNYEAGVMYFDVYANANYTVTIHFSRVATHFTEANTTQVLGIPSIHTEYIVLHALHRLSLRTGNENRAVVRNELEQMEKDIEDFYGRRDEDTHPQLSTSINLRK